jgi:hypothetical protein
VKERLAMVIAALWWGSLTTLGFLVVPMLFAHLPTPAQAGGMAARLFAAQTGVSVGCGLLLLMIFGPKRTFPSFNESFSAIGLVAFSMLLSLLVEFGVSPRIVARENLSFWHSAGSAMYFLQWICTGLLLWRLTGRQAP